MKLKSFFDFWYQNIICLNMSQKSLILRSYNDKKIKSENAKDLSIKIVALDDSYQKVC